MSEELDVTQPIGHIAIVDDDPMVGALMARWLRPEGFECALYSGSQVMTCAVADVVCLDLGLGDMPGMRVLAHLRGRDADATVVVIAAERCLDAAVLAVRAGAYDYLTKPLDRQRLVIAIKRAHERREMAVRLRALTRPSEPRDDSQVEPLRELERRAIERALRVAGGSVGKAAKLLGMGRATLYRRLAELGDVIRSTG